MSAPTQSSSHPILTKFPLSDGSSTTWPTNNTRILASDGSFDYYQVIGEEDPEFARWCTQISEQLQKVSPDGSKYALKELPEGYRLFRHLRGTEGKYRSDRYLYGSTSCTRFRSPSEFISHAIWLLTHPSPSSNTASSSSTTLDQARPVLDHNTCKCRYSISNSKPNRSPRKLKARPSNASLVLNDETPTPSPAKIKSKSGHVASVEGDILDQNSSIVQEQKAGTTVPVTKPPGEEESGERNENSGKDEEQRETEESTSAVSDHSQVNGALVLRGIDKQNEVGQAEEPVVIIKVQDELSLATIAVEQTEKTVLMNGKNEEGMMETDELVVPTKMREDADEEEFNGKESISIKGLDEPSEPMEAVIKKESVDQKELKESVAVVGQDRVDAPAITADETEDRSFSFTALSLRRRGDTPEETPAAIPSTPVFSSNSALVQGTNEIVFPISDGDTSTWPKNVETLSISDVTGFNNDNASSGSPASLPSGSQLDKTESSNPEFADSPNSRKNSPKYRVIQANERSMKTYLENVGHGVAQKLKDKLGLDGNAKYVLRSLPEGYRLFELPRKVQSGKAVDRYLYGHKIGKFRSTNEFVPHAAWLLESALEASSSSSTATTAVPSASLGNSQPQVRDSSKSTSVSPPSCAQPLPPPSTSQMSQKPSKPTFVFDHSKCLCPYGLRESRKKGGSSKLQSTHNRDKKATNGNIAKSRPEPEAEPQTQDTRVGMGSVRMITKPGDFNSKQLPSQSSLQGGQLELSVMRNWNVKAQAMALERFGKRDSAQMEAGGSNIQSTVQNASIGKGKGKERARSISSDHDSPGHKRAKVANGNMQDVGETNQEVASTSGSRPELVMIGLGPEHTTDTYEEQRSARKRRKPTRPDAHLPSPPPKRPRKSGESRTSAARNVNGTERATKPDPRIQKKAAQGRSFQRFQSRIETGMQSKILNQATYPRKKPFKEGELVFLSFQRPISGPSGDGSDDIRHWPAKIKKYTLSEDAYTIQPLGLADTQIVPSVHHASLLPYVAGQVPEQVITSLLSKDLTKSEYSVVRDYITGLWMAQRSAQTWGFGNSEARPPCLEEISSTEANISMSSSIPIYYRPTPPSSFSASKSFPYLWWGPERLEVNDLLRLKPSRNAFQDASIPNVYQVLPPSGPGRMMMQSCGNVVGLPLDGIMGGVISGAGLRGVVLRVREFFVEKNANDSDNDKPTWIVYACGMLYELADADWEQPYSMNEHAELPAAPKNYKFRPILSSTSEVVVSMDLVAGKYYAEASSHPSLANLVGDTLSSTASAGTRGVDYLWALECIVPGEMNVVFPATTTDKHRKEEEEGGQALPVWFWHEKAREELTETSDIMDQDTVKEKLENLKVT